MATTIFYDKNARWYNDSQDLLDGGTNEYLAGAEWDVTSTEPLVSDTFTRTNRVLGIGCELNF